jgi:hypothetical protein
MAGIKRRKNSSPFCRDGKALKGQVIRLDMPRTNKRLKNMN